MTLFQEHFDRQPIACMKFNLYPVEKSPVLDKPKDYPLSDREITTEDIWRAVEKTFGYSRKELCTRYKFNEFAQPRFMFMWAMRSLTKSSLMDIGRLLSRDHGTVISGIRALEKNYATSAKFRLDVHAFCAILGSKSLWDKAYRIDILGN